MLTEVVGALGGFVCLLLTVLYFHRKKCHKIFQQMGVPGPAPHWLFGNLHQMRSQPLYELIPAWTQKYGNIWGYYEGPTPVLVTSDVGMVQEVFVKQFRNFYGRRLFPAQDDPETAPTVNLFIAQGERWKRLRSTLNTSFTEARMRQMFPLVDNCVNKMIQSIRHDLHRRGGQQEEELDVYKYFQLLTLDTICECAFGVELNTQGNPNSYVIENLRKLFNTNRTKGPIMITGLLFPELRNILNTIQDKLRSEDSPIRTLLKLVKDVIKQRREDIKQSGAPARVDLLQMLLDSEVQPSDSASGLAPSNSIDNDTEEPHVTSNGVEAGGAQQCPFAHGASHTKRHPPVSGETKKHLSENEIVAQAMLFMFAGYETSSTTLAYCVFELVSNPGVLERLHDEIDSAMQDLPEEDRVIGSVNFYRTICQLPYLEAVIWETLRYHFIAGAGISRRCMPSAGAQVENYLIPQGTVVAADMYTIHLDENLWGPIPTHKFDPDRHLKLRSDGKYEFATRDHAMAMLGFGAGPKNCIGQRFALMEMRSCLARFFLDFTLKKGKKTPNKLPVRQGITVAPTGGVWLQVVDRKVQ